MKEYKSTLQHRVNQADLQRKYKDIDTQANFRDPLKMKPRRSGSGPFKANAKKSSWNGLNGSHFSAKDGRISLLRKMLRRALVLELTHGNPEMARQGMPEIHCHLPETMLNFIQG